MESRQVILIMTDTTCKSMLGCYGNPDMQTPHIDRLAREGVRYDRAYSTQPVCGPARSAIFTGLYPHSNQSVSNCLALGANVKTVGQRLTDQGIPCTYIGKWHLDGGDYFGLGTCPEGWNEKYWYDMRCYLNELTEEERRSSRNPDTSFSGITEDFTYAGRCTQRALRFLEENTDDSFFLTVSYDEPHDPSICPEPYCSMYQGRPLPQNPNLVDDLENKPYYQKLWAENNAGKTMEEMSAPNKNRSLFWGCNTFVDDQIGKLLRVIDEKYPDALVIFTSDHGDAQGAHRLFAKGPCVYEEICGVPLILRHPSVSAGTCSTPVSHINLTPTILDWFGLPRPQWIEGNSLVPQLKGEVEDVNDGAVFVEFTRYETDHDGFGGLQMMRAVITDRYKLAIHLLDTDELYDNQNDPYELHNLIDDPAYADIRDQLHDRLLAQMNATRDSYRGYQWKNRPWRSNPGKNCWLNDGYTRQRENEEYEPRQLDYDTGMEMESAVRIKKKAPVVKKI